MCNTANMPRNCMIGYVRNTGKQPILILLRSVWVYLIRPENGGNNGAQLRYNYLRKGAHV